MNNIFKIIYDFIMLLLNVFVKSNTVVAQSTKSVDQTNFTSQPSNIKMTNTPTLIIPTKTSTINGTDFGDSIMNVAPNQQREDLIFAQYQLGNVPDFMRQPISVTVTAGNNTLTYWVLPDVLCVGTDTDYLRTPLNPLTAKKVGDLFGCVLPTKKMADQIWQAATVKLTPNPNGPPYDETMQTTAKMVSHNAKVQASLAGKIPGELVTGHKKDVVLCKHLLSDPTRVAIYGWFYPTGAPIQGLNPSSHDKLYKDYSHGIRMVNRTMILNGNSVDFYSVLNDPSYANLISDEGSFNAMSIYNL